MRIKLKSLTETEMNVFLVAALLTLVFQADSKNSAGDDDLRGEIVKAKQKLQKDFILNLWYGANEAVLESQEKLIKLYTEYTIQQAEHVVEHITLHRNITRLECADKRAKALSTKNLPKLTSTLECIFKGEENTLKSYKMTGYNLHNCIRMAQNELEGSYLGIVQNLKNLMKTAIQSYEQHRRNLENCVENHCVLSNLFRSLIDYERYREEVATNVTEVTAMSTRYVFSRIAMGCVSGSLNQISENYKIGTGLVDDCLLDEPRTENANRTETLI